MTMILSLVVKPGVTLRLPKDAVISVGAEEIVFGEVGAAPVVLKPSVAGEVWSGEIELSSFAGVFTGTTSEPIIGEHTKLGVK
jgi:hypothetical protein